MSPLIKSVRACLFVLTLWACGGAVEPLTYRVSLSAPVTRFVRETSITLQVVVTSSKGDTVKTLPITWESRDTTLATVTSSGVVTGVGPGNATIVARAGSASGSVSIEVLQLPAPQPGPGDVIIWQDNFDSRTDFSGYARGGNVSFTDGRGGGKAARFSYTPTSDDNLIEKAFDATTDIYFRYWYRISPGWLPYSGRTGSGMKWFMPWRNDATPRYTCGVGLLGGGPAGFANSGWEFSCHDNSSSKQPNPFMQNVDKSRKFSTTNDGNWHEYVLHVVTGDGGYERIWVDGALVLDSRKYGYDHSSVGISLVQFPGLVVDGIPDAARSGTIDIDDFVIWRK